MVHWTFWILSQSIWTQKRAIKNNENKFTICCSEIDIVLLINHVSYHFLFSSVRLRNWVGPLHQLKEAASNKVTGIVVLLRQRQPKWLSIITASKFFWFGIHSKQQDTYCCSLSPSGPITINFPRFHRVGKVASSQAQHCEEKILPKTQGTKELTAFAKVIAWNKSVITDGGNTVT